MAKANCRNCKWAKWQLTASGRRSFWNRAECTYPVTVKLPASRADMQAKLERKVSVAEHADVPVTCDAWVKK
jgi:hypothetical protein